MILYSLCRKKDAIDAFGFKLYTVLLENRDLFSNISHGGEREREKENKLCAYTKYVSFSVFETGHRNMKNKIFIVFELSKFDKSD